MRSKGEREREGGREDKKYHVYTWQYMVYSTQHPHLHVGQSTAHYSGILVGEL